MVIAGYSVLFTITLNTLIDMIYNVFSLMEKRKLQINTESRKAVFELNEQKSFIFLNVKLVYVFRLLFTLICISVQAKFVTSMTLRHIEEVPGHYFVISRSTRIASLCVV